MAACRPVRKGDRFECRRPSHAGGPCKEAPLPDGTCAHVSPPCVPRPTLRTLRGRLSWLSVIVTLAVIALSANFIELSIARVKPGASIDPGPLSRAHTGFTRERGCVSCHASHGKSPLEWLADTTRPAGLSDGCTDCHSFDGPALAAHNTRFTHRSDLPELTCESCHTEHKGTDYDPSTVSDVTCVNCHQSQVSAFGRNHAEFPHNYPSDVPNSIRFDHNKHLKEYFQQAQWLDKPGRDKAFALQARIRCTACHLVESATREVKPAAFEQICAGCHSGQLEQRPLTVFMAGSTVPMSNFLLGLDEETEEEEIIEERHAEFLSAMAETQLDAFVEALAEQQSEERAPALFEALGAALVRNAASAWQEEESFEKELESEAEFGKWLAGEDDDGEETLRYRVTHHRDRVVRSWIEHAYATAGNGEDDAVRERGMVALAALLDPAEGPGACGKCHAAGILASLASDQPEVMQWGYRGSADRPQTRYSHLPHINLLGPDVSCVNCHKLNSDADYAGYFDDPQNTDLFVSNFNAIAQDTCQQCHRRRVVRFDCQMCHTYHRSPGFKTAFGATPVN